MPAANRRTPRQKPAVSRRSAQKKPSVARRGPKRKLEPFADVIQQWWYIHVICSPNCSRYEMSGEKLRLFLEARYGVKASRWTVWRETTKFLKLEKPSPNRANETTQEVTTSTGLQHEAQPSQSV